MSVYRAMWANTVSRTIMTVWRISVNMELSVWTLSMAIPASVKRVSGESHGNKSWTEQIIQTDINTLTLCWARLGGDTDGSS